jgi:hypothetical protein
MIAPTALRGAATGFGEALRPAVDRADTYLEQARGTQTRKTFLDRRDDTFTQIQRISGRHGFLPDPHQDTLTGHPDTWKILDEATQSDRKML